MERVSSVTGPAGTVQVTWEPGGARLETLAGDGVYQRWCYDSSGWLTEVLNATSPVSCGSTSSSLLAGFTYGYDGRGNRTSENYLSQGLSEQTLYGYDAADRLTGVQYPGSAVLYKLAADGTRLGEKTASYATDLGPLGFDLVGTPSEHLGYKYEDGRGALTSITDELNGSAIVASYQVDAAGRTKAETRGGVSKSFAWDAEGRLRSLTVTPPSPGTAWTASYAYDHAGRRVRKTGPSGATAYLWGDGELVSETPPGGAALVYQYVGSLPVAVGGERLLHDGLGSVAGRIGAGAPTLYRYSAWGELRGTSGPAVSEASLAYAGQLWDTDAGLSYAQQRWYDGRTGRFLSEDPVFGDPLQPNSLHAFGYGNGNPLLFTDPLGEASRKVYFLQEIEGLPREVKEQVLANIDPVLAKANYLDLSGFSDEQLVAGICTNLDASCDESGMEWLWERGRRKFGPGLQAFAERVSQSPAADAVRAIRAKAAEVDESLRDTATGTYRQALGPTANAIASSRTRPADAAPQVLAQTHAMSRNLGDATVDVGEEAAKYYLMGAVLKGGGAALEARTARAEIRAAERQAERAATGAGDEFVSFYHATSSEGAASIRTKGLDLSFSRPRTDFGRGFYTTTDRAQAVDWVAARHPGGEVLEFRVPRESLTALQRLDLGTKTEASLARFVRHNRLGGRLHEYDLVEGPMLGNPKPFLLGQNPRFWGQQTSFHSPSAFRLLEQNLVLK